MFDIPRPPDDPITMEQHRSLLWLSYCEHTAVLPWVRQVLRLAQAVEDDTKYRHTQRHLERLLAEIADLVDELWALDPEWCLAALGPRGVYPRGYVGLRFYDATEEEQTC